MLSSSTPWTAPWSAEPCSTWSSGSDSSCATAVRWRAASTLTLRFAGGTAWEKTRRLPEASAHEDDLRTRAYRLIDAAGLQRGRLTDLALRGEDLVDADQIAEQISLDQAREDRLVAEAVSDRIRRKFGPGTIGPAATFRHAS